MNTLQITISELSKLAEKHPEINVAYSGGKDSLAAMELCSRLFKKVHAFHFFLIPDLKVIEKQMKFCEDRWGVKPVQYLADRTCMSLKEGLWCNPADEFSSYRERPLKEMYATGLYLLHGNIKGIVATGMKDADGLKRRQFFANIRDGKDPFWNQVKHPIKDWNKREVLDFLDRANIPLPSAEKGSVTSGVGLDHDSLCWLHDEHPDDFARLEVWFPYIRAAIKRREFYGIGKK